MYVLDLALKINNEIMFTDKTPYKENFLMCFFSFFCLENLITPPILRIMRNKTSGVVTHNAGVTL